MKEQYKQSKFAFRVGFVIFLGVVAAIILLLGFGEGIFTSTYIVTAHFKYAGGIKKDTPVYMAGVTIGYVDHLIPPTAEAPYVKVVMNIYKNIDIRGDAILTIESLGLIGEKYLEFSIGSTKSPLLRKDGKAVIEGQGAGGLQRVQSTIADAAEEFKKTLKSISMFLMSKNFKKSMVKSFRTFAKFNKRGAVLFNELQNKVKELEIQNINKATEEMVMSLKKVQKTLDSFNEFIDESKRVVGELKNVQEVVNNAKSMLEKGNTILSKISQGEGTLGELINSKDFYFTVKNTLNRFDTTFNSLSDKLQTAIGAFTENVNEVKGLVKDIKSGKGTFGKLAYDEQAYNKLLDALEKVKTSLDSIKNTSDDAGKFIAEVRECPDIIVWGPEKSSCKRKYKSKDKKEETKRHRD